MKSIKYIVFVESSNLAIEKDENSWLGFVDAIGKHINKKDKEVKAIIQKQGEAVQS